jgi:hypothetical protein
LGHIDRTHLLTLFRAFEGARRRSQPHLARVGGIGRRAKILTREPFSDFILAYVGVSGNAR